MNETRANGAKATSGPWVAHCGFVATQGHKAICKMSYTGAVNFATGPATLEDTANAKLIAAAPDMFQALAAIVELQADHGRMNLMECAALARAALRRAGQ